MAWHLGAVSTTLAATMTMTILVPADTAEASTLLTPAEVVAMAERLAAESTGDGAAASSPGPTASAPSVAPSDGDEDRLDPTNPSSQVLSQLTDPLRMFAQQAQGPDGTITAGSPSTIRAEDLGIDLTFSGYQVDADLEVRIDDLPGASTGAPGASVRRAAASTQERAGLPDDAIVLVEPFDVVALAADGTQVTSFPTRSVQVPRDGEQTPVTDADIVPGVILNVPVEAGQVADIDTGSVRLYTRETSDESWREVASYLDVDTHAVYGELDHLSQFIVIGSPFVPDPSPRIVLDPDNDIAHTTSPSGKVTELPFTIQLAAETAARFGARCHADVLVTRADPAQTTLSQAVRAGMASAWSPDLTVTLAFDAVKGHPWGTETNGGSKVYPGDGPAALAVADSMNTQLPGYTGRPSELIGSSVLPYGAMRSLPGAVVHLEALNLDHNYDWPVIQNGMQHIADGVFTGAGMYLESQGFDCNDPKLGGWPARPSQAELERWRHLGHQNYQTYGADPVSFSTGNLIEDEHLFSVTGPGDSAIDLTLTYNSQDGRLTRTGAGWSFALGSRAQRFDDGGVLVVRGDGASFVYEPDGAGGFSADAGNPATLSDFGDGRIEQVDPDGTRWVYDTADIEGIGELVSMTDPLGHMTTLTYGEPDADDQFVPLVGITDAAGQTIQVESDGSGRIAAFTSPDGRRWSLGYADSGDLARITLPDSRVKEFTYDDAHRMTSATDPLGVTYLRNTFDAAGRVVEQWDGDGNRRTWTFDDAPDSAGRRSVRYTDNLGRESDYRFDGRYRIVEVVDTAGRTQTYDYNAADRITRHVDVAGRVTEYRYDAAGNLTWHSAPDGSTESWTHDEHGVVTSHTDQGGPRGTDRTTAWSVSSRGLPESMTEADGRTATAGYDAQGNLTSLTDAAGRTTRYEYDDRGNLLAEVDPTGARTSYSYDAANRMTSRTDALGARTEYQWDDGGRQTAEIDPTGAVTRVAYDGNDHPVAITDPLGGVTALSWDNLFRVRSVTDPTGAVTRYDYTAEDDLVAVTDPAGAQVRYGLDSADRVVTVTDPLGQRWTQTYDDADNVLTRSTPSGATTSYTYDLLDRETSRTAPSGGTWATSYDAVGRTVVEVDPLGSSTRYEYDLSDRITRSIDGLGRSTEYGYDAAGNQINVTDRRGQVWIADYDAADRLLSETDPLGSTTSYGYDAIGQLTSVTDALGATTRYSYDAAGRVVSEADPLGGTRAGEYDQGGRLIASTDATGATTRYGYDARSQLTSITDAVGALTTYDYDPAGRQTAVTDPIGTVTRYEYDAAAQLVAVVEAAEGTVGSVGITAVEPTHTEYTYDADGQLTTILNGRSFATEFGYDTAGRMVSETDPTGRTWRYGYDLAGRITTETDASGRHTTYAYDAVGDLTRRSYGAGDTVDYGYDAEHQLISMQDPEGATAWAYDAAGRLTQQLDTRGSTLSYDYDAVGRVIGLTLPEDDVVASTFDAAGRMTAQSTPWGDLAYTWDAAHRLTGTVRTEPDGTPGVTSAMRYDQVGRLTSIAHVTPRTTVVPISVRAATSAATVTDSDGRCTNTADYLSARTVPASGAGMRCHAAVDYLAARTVPAPAPVAANGDGLRYDYTYDAASNVTGRSTTVGTLATQDDSPDALSQLGPQNTVTTTHTYDALSRLRSSQSSIGDTADYRYDEVNNLIERTATTADSVTSWSSHVDGANRLTSATVTQDGRTADITYGLDGNGSRISSTVTGDPLLVSAYSMSARYGSNGKIADYTAQGGSTTYRYDGLGRAVSTATTEATGTVETGWTFDGLAPVAGTTDDGADIALVRDSLGNLALESDQQRSGTTDGTDRWSLLDALGSVVAQASAATGSTAITQLSSYDDYGQATQHTPGWSATLGYSGEMADLSTGSLAYYQRMYDPLTGTWTAQDAWRGLLARPQTLNGFGFVFGNPLSWTDLLGFAGMLIDGQWGSKGAYREGQKAREKVKPRTQAGYPAKWRPGRYPGHTPEARRKEAVYRLCDALSFRTGNCSNAWAHEAMLPTSEVLATRHAQTPLDPFALTLTLQGCLGLCVEIFIGYEIHGEGVFGGVGVGGGAGAGLSLGLSGSGNVADGWGTNLNCGVAIGPGGLDVSIPFSPDDGASVGYSVGGEVVCAVMSDYTYGAGS